MKKQSKNKRRQKGCCYMTLLFQYKRSCWCRVVSNITHQMENLPTFSTLRVLILDPALPKPLRTRWLS